MSNDPQAPSSDWYERAFQIDYLRVYKHRNDEEARKQIDFLTRVLELEPPLDIFDLSCGDGRHAIEWARRGYQVTGLDLSNDLLERARERADEAKMEVSFIQGDMREIPFTASFDLLVNFFTSFGYFREDAENEKVLHAISKALRPSGYFLMDYLNREHVIKSIVPEDRKEIDGAVLDQLRWVSGDPHESGSHVRINKQVTMTERGKSRSYEESVRMYTLDEMLSMISESGLKVTNTFGDFDGQPVSADAPRMILVGRKNT
jgi:SAM-dependent methyltransferase